MSSASPSTKPFMSIVDYPRIEHAQRPFTQTSSPPLTSLPFPHSTLDHPSSWLISLSSRPFLFSTTPQFHPPIHSKFSPLPPPTPPPTFRVMSNPGPPTSDAPRIRTPMRLSSSSHIPLHPSSSTRSYFTLLLSSSSLSCSPPKRDFLPSARPYPQSTHNLDAKHSQSSCFPFFLYRHSSSSTARSRVTLVCSVVGARYAACPGQSSPYSTNTSTRAL